MMKNVKLDIAKTGIEISADIEAKAQAANALLHSGKGAGNDFLGWVHLPSSISENEIDAIRKEAAKLRSKADVVVCIGIGGSYLGAKAVLEAMSDPFKLLHKEQKDPTVIFAGQNISEDYTAELLAALKEHSIAAIVISKSGTTTEPAIAFRLIKAEIEKRYGKKEAAERIVAITDKARGALKTLATQEGYPTFVIPDDVGGRFSVLTPVGLLPLAVAGVDIAALVRECGGLPFAPPERKRKTIVSSFSTAVELGRGPVIVGERINPTGKPKLKEALRSGRLEYLLSEGLAQEEAGAHILDVNVGLPGVDEAETLERAVCALQGVTALPLQLDSSDPRALERAMRRYNGKPMINSVSAKAESLAAVLPLVKKYGGVVVGLTLDEGGIPETAEGRVSCAERIWAAAAEHGIAREDVVIDTLTLTVSSEPEAARVTLEALRRIHEAGGRTTLGVSNVSFGLPAREKINSAFLTLALEAGLDCAIMNPLSPAMMSAWRAWAVLSARDARCEDYIAHESNTEPAKPAAAAGLPLGACIEKGLAQAAAAEAKRLVEGGAEPLEVINRELIPALDSVGKGFEAGTLYLPQLLMSAEAAGAAFEALKAGMKSGGGSGCEGKIVIATVKGDIHDIGKNIVRTLLENYGFEVRDLGKDVAPEAVLEAAREPGVRLVGLSALMTTTVAAMAETIALLRERVPGVKIMVGGAVLTEDYAREIGADFYAHDAMASVRYAKEVC